MHKNKGKVSYPKRRDIACRTTRRQESNRPSPLKIINGNRATSGEEDWWRSVFVCLQREGDLLSNFAPVAAGAIAWANPVGTKGRT